MNRFAIISDIHGNEHALRAVLARIASMGLQRIVCLGDIVGYGPAPDRCLDLVIRHCDVVVLGNHDLAVNNPRYVDQFNPIARQALEWTRDQLSPMHFDAFARWREIEYLGDTVTCVHDNPLPCPMTYVSDQTVAALAFRGVDTPICLVGHTHVPLVFETNAANVEDELSAQDVTAYLTRDGAAHPFLAGRRYICNPGSVGQPRDGDFRASFAVLDLDARTFTVHRQEYDIAAAQLASQRCGLHPLLADRLAVGA